MFHTLNVGTYPRKEESDNFSSKNKMEEDCRRLLTIITVTLLQFQKSETKELLRQEAAKYRVAINLDYREVKIRYRFHSY